MVQWTTIQPGLRMEREEFATLQPGSTRLWVTIPVQRARNPGNLYISDSTGNQIAMKFSKKERHDIYEAALSLILSGASTTTYLCWVLEKCSLTRGWTDYPAFLKHFPEVLAQKPKHTWSNLVWFDPHDSKSRITVLKKAIRLTKPKPRRKWEDIQMQFN